MMHNPFCGRLLTPMCHDLERGLEQGMASRFLSNAFYGEPANGTWTLTFFDFCGVVTPTQLSTLNPQLLGIVGH